MKPNTPFEDPSSVDATLIPEIIASLVKELHHCYHASCSMFPELDGAITLRSTLTSIRTTTLEPKLRQGIAREKGFSEN